LVAARCQGPFVHSWKPSRKLARERSVEKAPNIALSARALGLQKMEYASISVVAPVGEMDTFGSIRYQGPGNRVAGGRVMSSRIEIATFRVQRNGGLHCGSRVPGGSAGRNRAAHF